MRRPKAIDLNQGLALFMEEVQKYVYILYNKFSKDYKKKWECVPAGTKWIIGHYASTVCFAHTRWLRWLYENPLIAPNGLDCQLVLAIAKNCCNRTVGAIIWEPTIIADIVNISVHSLIMFWQLHVTWHCFCLLSGLYLLLRTHGNLSRYVWLLCMAQWWHLFIS